MTPLKHHHAYVVRVPDDRTAALALVDHCQEETGATRIQALRKVAAITVAAKRTKRLAVAARWLADKGEVGAYLRREILRAASGHYATKWYRILVTGFAPVRVLLRAVASRRQRPGGLTIAVSAGWVILRVAERFDPARTAASVVRAKCGPEREGGDRSSPISVEL